MTDRMEELYRSQHDRLWRSLLAFSGDPDIATDAAAETFSQAVSRGDELRDPAAWLWRTAFKVAGGMLADRQLRTKRTGSLDLSNDAHHLATTQSDSSLGEFLDLLSVLSEQQRAVVVLRYAGGFKPTEIAELLDTSPSSVRVQLHRAHGHLRERIDQS